MARLLQRNGFGRVTRFDAQLQLNGVNYVMFDVIYFSHRLKSNVRCLSEWQN